MRQLAYLLCLPAALAALAAGGACAQNVGPKVDAIIQRVMTQDAIPGMAVAVIKDGNVLYQQAYGVRSIDGSAKTDVHTAFSIGSVSKAFTAIGLMRLVQAHQLNLDDPIKKYMPTLPAAWLNITVRQFMAHTSGIPEVKGAKDPDFNNTAAAAGAKPLVFQPGARGQYNNFNFAIMGKLIEAVSGMDYLAYMRQQVFTPAGMTSTGVGLSTGDVSTGQLDRNGKEVAIKSHFKPGDYGVASGGLQTTLADAIQLCQALQKNTLLQKATTTTMWTPYSTRVTYTPGWESRMAGSTLVIHKGGGGTGIGSLCDIKVVPSQNIYVVVMINKDKIKDSPSGITDEILKQCFNLPEGPKGQPENE
ncbi:MAG TPA: serine hydrolase domain-containing protein [Dinghuibacter sp.]|uniref:serine hydrolase domain-containing protein n=1 Tax=Dinghuibacter sp. TaxID=2024697 RepID=UPI002C11F379|nr:serine hydrolase domain-containing protein [Dinghuibacter sp.]HTJ10834.1 serine hydrolase domain-containing protein [Dinghuibacter sp.]